MAWSHSYTMYLLNLILGDVSGVGPDPIPMTVAGEDQSPSPIPMLTSSTVLDNGSKND